MLWICLIGAQQVRLGLGQFSLRQVSDVLQEPFQPLIVLAIL
jgi:hypothetical protein